MEKMIFKIAKKQTNSYDCLICGKDNKAGLFAPFYETTEGQVISVFKTKQIHQSYPERTHGGVVCAMLDEIAGRAVWLTEPDALAVTGSITVKYHKPTPLDTELLAVGQVDKNFSRGFVASAKIFDKQHNLLAESTGTYIKQKPTVIAKNTDLTKDLNIFLPDKNEVKIIEW